MTEEEKIYQNEDFSEARFGMESELVSPVYEADTGFIPYNIRFTASAINVRNGPGIENPVVRTIIPNGLVFKVVEEVNGWGKIEAQPTGYVLLKHAEKL